MARNVAQKLIAEHLVDGEMTPGAEVGVRIDQTLTQDATGTIFVTGRMQGDAADVDEGTKSDRAKHQDSLWRIVPADQVPPGAETVPIEDRGHEDPRSEEEPVSAITPTS